MTWSTAGVTACNPNFVFLSETNEPAPLAGYIAPHSGTIALSSAATQHERIAIDQDVLGGTPFVRGTRIPIYTILDGMAEGLTPEDLMEHYQRLTLQDIQAALEYSASMSLAPAE